MHPTDAWTMFINRAAAGSGTFDMGIPFSQSMPMSVWGQPVYRTRAMTLGHALVSDFARSAIILDRESVNVQIYQERYAELNEVLILCEERVGLAIPRPDGFCDVSV